MKTKGSNGEFPHEGEGASFRWPAIHTCEDQREHNSVGGLLEAGVEDIKLVALAPPDCQVELEAQAAHCLLRHRRWAQGLRHRYLCSI